MPNNYKSNYREIRSFLLSIPDIIDRRTKKAMEDALEEVAHEVLDLALLYVPRDTTKLAQTGRYSDVTWNGNTAKVTIAFGGGKVDYAYYVEFSLPDNGTPKSYTTPGTGPLYLTRAVDEVATKENIRIKFLKNMRRTKQ